MDAILKTTASAAQALAAEPGYHVWVSANAGSGKTRVLTLRILRLLLADRGLLPRQIVALTFTKAVAREMVVRLHESVRGWDMLGEDPLTAAVFAVTGATPDGKTLQRARELPALLRSDPPLVTTLHGFGQMVLARFPREAGLVAGFSLIEGPQQERLLREALQLAITGAEGMVADALDRLLDVWGDDALTQMTSDLTQGETWNRLSRLLDDTNGGVATVRARVCTLLGLDAGGRPITPWPRAAEEIPLLQAWASALAAAPSATNDKTAIRLGAVISSGGRTAWRDLFLKADGGAYAPGSLGTKAVQAALGDAWEEILRLRQHVVDADDGARAERVYQLTDALLVWSRFVKEIYESLKRERGLVDFSDMITRLQGLLEGTEGQWIHYRLDRSIRHLLLDEGQDNSPAQHAVFGVLANELLSGDTGALLPHARRTVFAVGDMKQSIYRFQGAKPELFLQLRERLAMSGETIFREVDLTHNFRSAPAVLDFVDKVFASPLPAGVVRGDDKAWSGHTSVYPDAGGTVEIWPLTEAGDDADNTVPEERDGWRPPGPKAVPPSGAVRVGELIAADIQRRLEDMTPLGSTGKRARLGDVLVLVQRNAVAIQLAAVLERMGIPAQVVGTGANGTTLAADVTAWLRACVNSRDRVSLATVLKSPMAGWSDAQLLALHQTAGDGDWWQAVRGLDYEIYTWLEESRTRLLCDGSLPALLWLAEERKLTGRYSGGNTLRQAAAEAVLSGMVEMALDEPEPVALVARLEQEDVKPAAVPPGDAVQIMTVHRAKGLEAPLVYVAETTKAYDALGNNRENLLWEEDSQGLPTAVLWWAGTNADKPRGLLALEEAEMKRRRADSLRNLYVALTRAKDRLVVCGWRGTKQDPMKTDHDGVPCTWYGMAATSGSGTVHGNIDVTGIAA